MSDGTPPPPPPYGGSDPEPSPHPPGASQPAEPYASPPPQSYGQAPEQPYGQQYGEPYGQQYGQVPGQYGGPAGQRPGELLDRFVAKLIDLVIIFVVNLVLDIVIGILAFAGSSRGTLGMGGSFAFGALTAIIATVLYLGYFSYLESSRGQTIGKMVMKLRVLSPSGAGHPTMNEALKRNIWTGLPILGIIPFLGILAYPLILVAEIVIAVTISNDQVRRQSWFDKFAGGTQVVKEG